MLSYKNTFTVHKLCKTLFLAALLLWSAVAAALPPNIGDNILIGIAWRADTTSEFYTNVVRAIREAGGTPVLLKQVKPLSYQTSEADLLPQYTDSVGILLQPCADYIKSLPADESNVADAVAEVSAVVFTGGEDISPTLFRTPQPWHGIEEELDYNATRDISDYLTMRYCIEHDIPLMGLCRGMQMLAVISGATVIQDIPTHFATLGTDYLFTHRNIALPGVRRDYASHSVRVTIRHSLLYAIANSDTIAGAPSWHHQCVRSVKATPLRVTGVTDTQGIDIIEALEHPDKTFCIGLQFHPEAALVKHLDKSDKASLFMSYDTALRYFQTLVAKARIYKQQSEAR